MMIIIIILGDIVNKLKYRHYQITIIILHLDLLYKIINIKYRKIYRFWLKMIIKYNQAIYEKKYK